MPQEQNDNLRSFIDKLESWPADKPPSLKELRELKKQFPLTEKELDKLDLISDNHRKRGRDAFTRNAYGIAIAELSRACQLSPRDPNVRLELAEVYLHKYLDKNSSKQNRLKAERMAASALEIAPGTPGAKQFLKELQIMSSDFRSAGKNRFILPLILLVFTLAGISTWKRDWVFSFFTKENTVSHTTAITDTQNRTESSAERNIEIITDNINGENFSADIYRSAAGKRDNGNYLDIRGKLLNKNNYLGLMEFQITGRENDGNIIFSIPWLVRDSSAPLLTPGDTQPLTAFRWLDVPDYLIERIEITPLQIKSYKKSPGSAENKSHPAEIVWKTPRPDGVNLNAEIRKIQVIEAFDTVDMLMDISVKNTGSEKLTELELGISLTGSSMETMVKVSGIEDPPIAPGEQRVFSTVLRIPPGKNIPENTPVTVFVEKTGR